MRDRAVSGLTTVHTLSVSTFKIDPRLDNWFLPSIFFRKWVLAEFFGLWRCYAPKNQEYVLHQQILKFDFMVKKIKEIKNRFSRYSGPVLVFHSSRLNLIPWHCTKYYKKIAVFYNTFLFRDEVAVDKCFVLSSFLNRESAVYSALAARWGPKYHGYFYISYNLVLFGCCRNY